eukprot:gene3190-4036_t
MAKIDNQLFGKRLSQLYDSFKNKNELWGDAPMVAIGSGPAADSEEIRYLKSLSLHIWLFNYELPDTLLVFTKDAFYAIASGKRAALLQSLQGTVTEAVGLKFKLYERAKGTDGSAEMETLLKDAGQKTLIGTLIKEKPTGAFLEQWDSLVSKSKLKVVDATLGVADCLACKDVIELSHTKRAAQITCHVMKEFLVAQLESVIDEEKTISHSKLAERTEKVVIDPSKVKLKVREGSVDVCYVPVIQSGGTYDLRPGALCNDDALHYGVILCSLGTRYNSYCSNVSRTYLVDPTKQQEATYKIAVAAQNAAISALVEGAPMSAVMQAAVASLQGSAQPELVQNLTKNCGFLMGLEFKDSTAVLNAKNEKTIRADMVFNVSLGLQGLENPEEKDPKAKQCAFLLADTVLVRPGGQPPEILTSGKEGVPKAYKEVAYYVKGEDEAEEVEVKPEVKAAAGPSAVLDTNLRSQGGFDEDNRRRKAEQKELADIKNQETLERLEAAKEGAAVASGNVGRTNFLSYRSPDEMPRQRDLAIMVDKTKETVLLPIYGQMVPFHIQTIKSASTSNDGTGKSIVRIHFNVPGTATYGPGLKFMNATFFQEICYRTTDARHAETVVTDIKTIKRVTVQKENERAERATLVRQEPLQLSRGKHITLQSDLHIKPPLQAGQKGARMTGALEAHVNGFRYAVSRNNNMYVDISYKNIKHAFYQPAENAKDQLQTLIHFHLHDPIMIGKKKTADIQVFVNVIDAVESLDAGRRSMYDVDEIEEEQRERERRKKVNKIFSEFIKRVQDLWDRDFRDLSLEFDVPFRKLGFHGVPHKSQAFVLPTVHCLIELIETPFFIVSLEEIEIVNLERIGFGLKDFDMAIIFKDFNRPVHRIDCIPVDSLDRVKEWLHSVNLKYYENKMNLHWGQILKTILADPQKFVDDGGWEFLNMEDAYVPSDEGDEEEEDDSAEEKSEDDESLVDSDEEDSEEDEDEEEEDEGMSDDELEKWAANEDRERDMSSDDEDERRAKRKGKSGGGPPPKRGRR